MAKEIPLERIVDNPFQPRTTFDPAALQSLADEMKAEGFWNGSLQGRKTTNGNVELVFGHRRLRALRLLKVPSVHVEILDLTDAQMALRSLEENLQREGLTDLEKADAVKRAVDIERVALKAAGKNQSHAVPHVAKRLGVSKTWVGKLCQISATMVAKNRAVIEAKHITALTALAAKTWGGPTYVETLAKQGKQAAEDGSVGKPTHMTVAAMKKVVTATPEPIREKLKEEIVEGKITTPEQAEKRARSLASARTKRNSTTPKDLREVIVGWTYTLRDWEKQMREVAPYMDYVDEVPAIAGPFREALKELIDTAKRLL